MCMLVPLCEEFEEKTCCTNCTCIGGLLLHIVWFFASPLTALITEWLVEFFKFSVFDDILITLSEGLRTSRWFVLDELMGKSFSLVMKFFSCSSSVAFVLPVPSKTTIRLANVMTMYVLKQKQIYKWGKLLLKGI